MKKLLIGLLTLSSLSAFAQKITPLKTVLAEYQTAPLDLSLCKMVSGDWPSYGIFCAFDQSYLPKFNDSEVIKKEVLSYSSEANGLTKDCKATLTLHKGNLAFQLESRHGGFKETKELEECRNQIIKRKGEVVDGRITRLEVRK